VEPADIPAMRTALEAARAALVAEGPAEVRAASEVVPSANDEDEAPHREMDQAIASSRNRARSERIAAIDAALMRLEQDPEGFGVCEGCGEDIPQRRLTVMPFTRRCVACQEQHDDPVHGRATRRRVTDYR
jgi:DnaK suppressor protein